MRHPYAQAGKGYSISGRGGRTECSKHRVVNISISTEGRHPGGLVINANKNGNLFLSFLLATDSSPKAFESAKYHGSTLAA